MSPEQMMVLLTGVIAVSTLGNLCITIWYARSTRKILLSSFVKDLCELYAVRQVKRKTDMFKILLPKEFSKVEAILQGGD